MKRRMGDVSFRLVFTMIAFVGFISFLEVSTCVSAGRSVAIQDAMSRMASCGTADCAELVPTLKDIFGKDPKQCFPLKRTDAPDSPFRGVKERSFQSDAETSFKRAQALAQSVSSRRGLGSEKPTQAASQVVSGTFSSDTSVPPGFYVKFQIGTPVQDVLLILDTGSNVLWVQSADCISCYDELLPRYNFTSSSTFEPKIYNGTDAQWQIGYGDGGQNGGIIATETLTIDSGYGSKIVISGYEFGLSKINTGNNDYNSGILGMGVYPGSEVPSFPTYISPFLDQLATIDNGSFASIAKKFRYCFPDRVKQPSSTSFLSLGDIDNSDAESLYSSGADLHESKTLWTPIIPDSGNPEHPFFYYALNLTAIVVDGTRIDFDPLELTEAAVLDSKLTILDSGSTLTAVREPYFSLVIETYFNATINLGANISDSVLMYNITQEIFEASIFPSISFIFQKWMPPGQGHKYEEIELVQPADNILIPSSSNANNTDHFYIFNMSPASDNTTNIIGNFAQENFLVEFDLENARVGFLRASCAFE